MIKVFEEPRETVLEHEISRNKQIGYILINPERRYTKSGIELDIKGELYAICDEESKDDLYKTMSELHKAGVSLFISADFEKDGIIVEE